MPLWVQRFKAPPSPFSAQRQRGSNGGSSHGSDAASAVLQQRLAGGGSGGAVLRDCSDGSDNGWEEVCMRVCRFFCATPWRA